ncbi:MAG: NUDIX hydrolase [Bacteroidota bacterium]
MQENTGNWKRIASEKGPSLKLFDVRLDTMQNLKTGKSGTMTVLESADSVNVLAITTNAQMLLVRQYRFGIAYETLELPGGIVDPGEDSLQAAQRELREETGYSGEKWTYLGSVPSNPVFMDSRIHHWVASQVSKTHDLSLDDEEDIEVVQFPLADLPKLLQQDTFEHPHTLSALYKYLQKP